MSWRLSQNKTLWPQYHQTTLHQLSYGKGEREREKSRVKKVGAYQLSVKISYKWVIPRAKTIF